MTNERLLLEDIEFLKRLAEHLQRIPSVTGVAGESAAPEEAWAIAVSLRDIERSMQSIFGELVPALMKVPSGSHQAEELLRAIGEEYRHVLYHLQNTRYFEYLRGSV